MCCVFCLLCVLFVCCVCYLSLFFEKVVLCVVCSIVLLIVKHQCLACIVMVTTTEVIMNTPSS